MSNGTVVRRPGGVTFVVVLTWLVAISAFLAGVLALVLGEDALTDAGLSQSTRIAYAVVEFVFGIVTALVAGGLARGSRAARTLVALLMGARVLVSAFAMWQIPNGVVLALTTCAFALLIISLLFSARANEFFHS